jgi:hypothetical protein
MSDLKNEKDRLYLYGISRRDLPPHQQAIQAAHAQLEYVGEQSMTGGDHPNFVWLTVKNRRELMQLAATLRSFEISVVGWSDCDYPGYELSAIACALPYEHKFLLQDLPLWVCKERGIFDKLFGRN